MKAAVVDMKAVIGEETETVVYVGITCGFSAPYVAAQLDCILLSQIVLLSTIFLCQLSIFCCNWS